MYKNYAKDGWVCFAQQSPLLCFEKWFNTRKNTPFKKWIMRINLICIVMLLAFLQISHASNAQNITLSRKNISLVDVFKEIKRQSGYDFVYKHDLLQKGNTVNINVDNQSLNEVLIQCFKNQPFEYIIEDKTVIIVPLAKAPAVQQKTVKGSVIDNIGPLPGVSVMEKGTNNVTVTNNEGEFTLPLKTNNATLVFSLIGYEVQEIPVGTKTEINVTLTSKVTDLQEVVVTALGIERDQKALGYATTVIKTEALTEVRSNNWLDALSGKVAGLNLIRSNAGPAGSTKVILRGESNLTGDNDALIVVDGVVINHGSARATASAEIDGGQTAVDWGTSLNDINPDDIENVTVLKGAGAAALYGGRGGNGAIIITTKLGKSKHKGLGITINSNFAYETINRQLPLQYEYGQGEGGALYYSFNSSEDGPGTNRTTNAFGPKFEGQMFYQYDPVAATQGKERTLWQPYKKDGFMGFFDPATTLTNTVTIDGGTDKTSARFSYTNLQNKWIVPNTGYDRNTVAVAVNSKPSKNLQINTRVNYTHKLSENLPTSGYGNQTLMYGFIFWQPNVPIEWLKDYWTPGQEHITQRRPFTTGTDNPYVIAHEYLNKMNRNSVTGNISAIYTITDDLTVTARTSMDMGYDQRSQQRPMDSYAFRQGLFRTQGIFSQEMSSDFMVKYNRSIKDFDLTASVGGSTLQNHYNKHEVRADSLIYPGIYTTANSSGILVSVPYSSRYTINSLYGLFTAGYKDFAFVDFSIRNDWTSMLATPLSKENVSIIYPGLNASLILSEIFKLPGSINYAKIRASVSGVGSGQNDPYGTSITYTANSLYSGGGLSNPTTLANPLLRPLFTNSYETGLEGKFFKNRLGMDLTFYLSNTSDQILTSIVDPASGMANVIINAGMVQNKGIEVALNGTPVKRPKGLTWDINAQFSSNRNIVKELAPGMNDLTLQNGPSNNGFIIARVGGSMGDLYGRGYLRSPDGQIVYNNGFPILSDSLMYQGNTVPKGKVSINNQFKYKNFRVSFLLDGQYGSVGYAFTNSRMALQGKTTETLPGRYNGIVGNGVIANVDGAYRPNDIIVENLSDYYDSHFGISNVESSTFSTAFIKLRECRLDYTFKVKAAKKLGLQRATIGIYGRDLFILSKWPGFDPEFGTLSGTEINRGFERGQFPSTRTIGANLTVAF